MLTTLSSEEKAVTRNVSVATGEAAAEFMKGLIDDLTAVCPNVKCTVYPVKNRFFGGEVTVTGLLTGKDMAEQLAGKDLGDTLFLSRTTLRSEGDLFLCGMTPDELSEKLAVPLCFTENDGGEFLLKLLGLE
jgi:NifB/MoaA-like Fe-S oxidoreductase